jgi:hypothetical protein
MALPDYTVVDLSASYSADKYAVRFKLSNVFDKLSYNVHDDNSVNPIAPRHFLQAFPISSDYIITRSFKNICSIHLFVDYKQ